MTSFSNDPRLIANINEKYNMPSHDPWEITTQNNEDVKWLHPQTDVIIHLNQSKPEGHGLPFHVKYHEKNNELTTNLYESDFLGDSLQFIEMALLLYQNGFNARETPNSQDESS